MAGTSNKVKFNVKNVHYAKKTAEGTYDTPVAIPGAVSLTLEQQGEITAFWADGVKYYNSASNGGYEGDLEVALIPDEFRKDILGEEADTNNVLFENADTESQEFALGFQVDGDKGPILFWFYNCTATRPSVSASTTQDTKEPSTDTMTISAAAAADGTIRAKTTAETSEDTTSAWFEEVYIKNAVAAAAANVAEASKETPQASPAIIDEGHIEEEVTA